MRHILMSSALIFTLPACGAENSEPSVAVDKNIVRAELLGADQTKYGEVIVAAGTDGLLVKLNVEGLNPGQHGVHIHDIGKCDGPDFKSSGGHWNPGEKAHGFDNMNGAHMGDFFNLDIGSDGKGSLEATIDGGRLKGGDGALIDDDGAAFVIHEGPDDLKSDPSGNSGSRIACGVFEG